MSNYHFYGPGLESELDYRRTSLRHDADLDRLAREARRGTRSARAIRRLVPGSRSAVRPATRAA
jgi:hypothetical protein